ncbi:MAG: DUF1330 domain-containing protein [Proteobacteria bacterium]|nr:DUF1330 domain-containing protein [Pseudomonadota bacterium]
MTGYLVAFMDVTDPDAYEEYKNRAPAVVQKHGGKFIARGGRSLTLEGDPPPGRMVIIEFPSVERAVDFYNSPEYREAMAFRQGAAKARMMVVEGV